ncbi:MAG: putative rane protein [Pseudonocardia sp.]|jgi:hypothetical protein|nr:putative rane protein [Pseudonocardia sp.]
MDIPSSPSREAIVALVVGALADLQRRFPAETHARGGEDLAVHSVELVPWIAGLRDLLVPVPTCRVGLAGWDPTRFSPTRDPVTCGTCLRGGAGRAAPEPPTDLDQLQLFDTEEDRPDGRA